MHPCADGGFVNMLPVGGNVDGHKHGRYWRYWSDDGYYCMTACFLNASESSVDRVELG